MPNKILQISTDGFTPQISPDHRHICCGSSSALVYAIDGTLLHEDSRGRAPGFFDNDTVYYIDDEANVIRSFKISTGQKGIVSCPSNLVAGNVFKAKNNHFASWLQSEHRIMYDAQNFGFYDGLEINGKFLLTTIGGTTFQLFRSGDLAFQMSRPDSANLFFTSPNGWISWGYYGPSLVCDPLSRTITDVTITPWRQEGPARIVHPDIPWIVTATVYPNDEPAVLIRPLESITAIICRGFGATDLDVVLDAGVFYIVGCSGNGEIQVWSAELTEPREIVREDVPVFESPHESGPSLPIGTMVNDNWSYLVGQAQNWPRTNYEGTYNIDAVRSGNTVTYAESHNKYETFGLHNNYIYHHRNHDPNNEFCFGNGIWLKDNMKIGETVDANFDTILKKNSTDPKRFPRSMTLESVFPHYYVSEQLPITEVRVVFYRGAGSDQKLYYCREYGFFMRELYKNNVLESRSYWVKLGGSDVTRLEIPYFKFPREMQPVVTINSYEPKNGKAPLSVAVQCVLSPMCGFVDKSEILVGDDVLFSTKDYLDLLQTIQVQKSGNLRFRATGPGGIGQTGASRPILIDKPMPSKEIFIRAYTGKYVCAEGAGWEPLIANRDAVGTWEKFLAESLGDNYVALKSLANNNYVSLRDDTCLVSTSGYVGDSETFEKVDLGNNTFSIKAVKTGQFWCAEQDQIIRANRGHVELWETFSSQASAPVPIPGGKPDREKAKKFIGEFLCLHEFNWMFMIPGWSLDKRMRCYEAMRQKGYTHIPFAPWGAYPNSGSPQFDYRNNITGFKSLINEMQSEGMIACVFCLTDSLPGENFYSKDWAKKFIRDYISQLRDIVRLYASGWEFNQIDGSKWTGNGENHREILQEIRNAVGSDNLLYAHFTPGRITGWPNYPDHSGPQDEASWWKNNAADGLLSQRDYNEKVEWTIAHTTGGDAPNDEGEMDYDKGDAQRIVYDWGVHKIFTIFEYSRNTDRSNTLNHAFDPDHRCTGNCNRG